MPARVGRVAAASDDAEYDLIAYSPEANAAYWSARPVALLSRGLEVAASFAKWQLGRKRSDDDGAASLTRTLERLGPSLTKIGQALGSRPDLLPPPFVRALESLQDQVPPFDDDQARAVIAVELGVESPDVVFSSLSSTPVAAASLGQVYRGTLRPEYGGGEAIEVAVKVQRPGVAATLARDAFLLRAAAGAARTVRRVNTDLPALVDEWAGSLFRELDYRVECANGERFRALYGSLDGVHVPPMVPSLCTRRVLVMHWVDGVRLRSAGDVVGVGEGGARAPPSLDGAADLALVDVGVRCSLEQMLESGFFHSDPHPGNLLRTRDGRLAYIDFGMCGEVDATTRTALVTATLHLVNREYAALARDMVTLGFLPPGSDMGAIVPALTGVFQRAARGGIAALSFSDLSSDLGRTMYDFSFRLPPYYTLLVRSLTGERDGGGGGERGAPATTAHTTPTTLPPQSWKASRWRPTPTTRSCPKRCPGSRGACSRRRRRKCGRHCGRCSTSGRRRPAPAPRSGLTGWRPCSGKRPPPRRGGARRATRPAPGRRSPSSCPPTLPSCGRPRGRARQSARLGRARGG